MLVTVKVGTRVLISKLGADGKQFFKRDSIVFNYEYGKHNVALLPDKASLDNCILDKPILTLADCGRNCLFLCNTGPCSVASTKGDDCKKGLKFSFETKPLPAVLELEGAQYLT
ncbi:putative Phytocyanin domain, cupredoxin [Helianthus annuus]|uniref:Phytocyanin domain, cupredoxin n=1 Tax=Helianthus annuus TaxID=4232 RepID=A0A251UPG5_HELAN|nr:putative Phytocyanin domain, cupredoxin [Helianthus annuus]KAJ0569594.1 putative Phytocyanin domain, cupredoxin [Helianthus annuus]KAJ0583905.1 putative Phytocyanin domain, cupredoxin [Helianthus annuus]KAJ0918157.1 putative Phytocyanin domain, cupredoxin [Helianthus annuus]KAJ0921920.1 putative Phytocyanin domain, cupredoxin [Helianthus annuus]